MTAVRIFKDFDVTAAQSFFPVSFPHINRISSGYLIASANKRIWMPRSNVRHTFVNPHLFDVRSELAQKNPLSGGAQSNHS